MNNSNVLRYGFEWDRDWTLDFIMNTFPCFPIANSISVHPYVLYLLFRRSCSMGSHIRIGYMLTVTGLIFYDWTLSFFIRLYILAPLPAIHCEGILCTMGLPKHVIMAIISSAFAVHFPGFFWLVFRLHGTVASWKKWKLSNCSQVAGIIFHIFCTAANVVGFTVFGRDSDDYTELLQREPEYDVFVKRGGTLFIFGAAGAPQYLKYELFILCLGLATNAVPLIAMMTHAIVILSGMGEVAKSEKSIRQTRALFRTVCLQMNSAFLFVILPFLAIVSMASIDTRKTFPNAVHATIRFVMITLISVNPFQFGLMFTWRNPSEWSR
ncbi:hypothetical protein PRIPAC_81140, partial [Pristionchus pacificus]|uniref:G protein-coupled receptor n=1 Tax=Pristionchus pacificus TaxID=54126 RepID=A0A2A6CPB0_PRIPA